MTRSDSEWDQRILCSDGNCIGIIGADGHCKTCGLRYEGKQPLPAASADAPDDDTAAVLPAEGQMTEEGDPIDDDQEVGTDAHDDAWENRTLCVDESCIGVVGPDGRCKECGKPHPG